MGFENGKLVRVVVRVTENATGDEQVNALHYDLKDAVGFLGNDPQALADAFGDDVLDAYALLYSTAWTIQPVTVVQEIDPQHPTSPRSEWSAGTAQSGLRTPSSDLLPKAMCAVASLPTSHIGRRFRGRIFLGGSLQESDQAAGTWGSAILALWQNLLDAIPHQPDIVTGASDSTANWGVYSRTQRAANLDPYISPVTAPNLRTKVHWLRSRE